METSITADQICSALTYSLSDNKDDRQKAEEFFDSYTRSQPDDFLVCFFKIIGQHSDCTVRQQAVVLLRSVLFKHFMDNNGTIWMNLKPDTKIHIKINIFHLLNNEQNKMVQRSICDAISFVITRLHPHADYVEMLSNCLLLMDSSRIDDHIACCRILTQVARFIPSIVSTYSQRIRNLIHTLWKLNDDEIRYECLCLLVTVIESESQQCLKEFQFLLPDILDCLIKLSKPGQEGSISSEIMFPLIDIAEENSLFFKPYIEPLVDALSNLIQSNQTDDEIKQESMELLITISSNKPEMCLVINQFIPRMIAMSLQLMLSIKDDNEWVNHLDDDDDRSIYETTNIYDVGESALDHWASIFRDNNVISIIFSYITEYLKRAEWEYQFVAIMAISQTVEYISDDQIHNYLQYIVEVLLNHTKNQDYRVRFVVYQAIRQISIDHQPYFQNSYYDAILPELIKAMDDVSPQVKLYVILAITYFIEYMHIGDFLPYSDTVVTKLFDILEKSMGQSLTEDVLHAIATVAKTMKSHFARYYPFITPFIKDIIGNPVSKENPMLSKAINCLSTIGFAVGAKVFKEDGIYLMNTLFNAYSNNLLESILEDFFPETISYICEVLDQDFFPFADALIPIMLKSIRGAYESDNNMGELEIENMKQSNAYINDEFPGIKTAISETVIVELELIANFLKTLGGKLEKYFEQIGNTILPLLKYSLLDDLVRDVFYTMSILIEKARQCQNTNQANYQLIMYWMMHMIEKVFVNLRQLNNLDNNLDPELVVTQVEGLVTCIKASGSHLFEPDKINEICTNVFVFITESKERYARYRSKPDDEEYNQDDASDIDDDQDGSPEKMLAISLLEVLSCLMSLYPDSFLNKGGALCQNFIAMYFTPNCSVDDRTLAVFLCDDILEHLKDNGIRLWPCFMQNLVSSITDKNAKIRQASCYGIIHASKCSNFLPDLARYSANNLVQVLTDSEYKPKENQSVTDNATAALGSIIMNHGSSLQSSLDQYFNIFLDNLPLKDDVEEGLKTHKLFVDWALQNTTNLLNQNNTNLQKITAICSQIYTSKYSSPEIDELICKFISSVGFPKILSFSSSFDIKIKKGLERIHRDVNNVIVQYT